MSGWDGIGERRCVECGVIIRDCNGFCNASDFLRLLLGEAVRVRELCGRCILLSDPVLLREIRGEMSGSASGETA